MAIEVYGGATAKAHCLGGDASYVVSAVGFGIGTTPELLSDTALNAVQYVKPIAGTVFNLGGDGVSYIDASGGPAQVKWLYSINSGATKDYGAIGLNVTEIGLFANPTALDLPARTSPLLNYARWTAATAYAVNDTVIDSNGNLQTCTAISGDNLSGSSEPAWLTTVGTTNTDDVLTWTMTANHVVSGLFLVARALFTIGLISGSVGFQSYFTDIIPPGVA